MLYARTLAAPALAERRAALYLFIMPLTHPLDLLGHPLEPAKQRATPSYCIGSRMLLRLHGCHARRHGRVAATASLFPPSQRGSCDVRCGDEVCCSSEGVMMAVAARRVYRTCLTRGVCQGKGVGVDEEQRQDRRRVFAS